MQIKSQIYAALGIAAVGITLVGCGLGAPSNTQIEASIRQLILTGFKEDGAPSSYMENLQNNLKVTVLKNNGCKPAEEKAFECDLTLEIDAPGYKRGGGLPDLEAKKQTAEVKAKFVRTPDAWVAQDVTEKQ